MGLCFTYDCCFSLEKFTNLVATYSGLLLHFYGTKYFKRNTEFLESFFEKWFVLIKIKALFWQPQFAHQLLVPPQITWNLDRVGTNKVGRTRYQLPGQLGSLGQAKYKVLSDTTRKKCNTNLLLVSMAPDQRPLHHSGEHVSLIHLHNLLPRSLHAHFLSLHSIRVRILTNHLPRSLVLVSNSKSVKKQTISSIPFFLITIYPWVKGTMCTI